MGAATVVCLSARPWKASLLSFEIGGILGQLNTQLGDSVTPFVFPTFYAGLDAAGGDGSLLTYNSQGILTAAPVTASMLAALRAEPRAAALDRAVYLRQNAYYAKYSPANITNTVTQATTFYGGSATANPAMLGSLAGLAQTQADVLDTTYTATGRGYSSGNPVVVQTTSSSLTSKTVTTDSSTATPNLTSTTTPNLTTRSQGQGNQADISGPNFTSASLGSGGFPGPLPGGGADPGDSISGTSNVTAAVVESTSSSTSTETGTSTDRETGSESSTGAAYAVQTESVVNTDYTYRVPSVEARAQNLRAQISLNDQQFGLFMTTQNLPNLATVLQNELSSIDLSVYQLQIGFLSSILLSPLAGTVTGIYKNPGDPVRPGEPVVRVEDNSTLFLLGTVVYRGAIQVGSTVAITTQLFDATGPVTPLNGQVIAVRGRGDDDVADLVIQCTNPLDGGGNPTFPIGYVFDYDNTNMTIT